jgi:hypothetical protein
MLDADTVKTVAKKVKPKSDETNARRCVNRRDLYMGILKLFEFQNADKGKLYAAYRNFTHVHHREPFYKTAVF